MLFSSWSSEYVFTESWGRPSKTADRGLRGPPVTHCLVFYLSSVSGQKSWVSFIMISSVHVQGENTHPVLPWRWRSFNKDWTEDSVEVADSDWMANEASAFVHSVPLSLAFLLFILNINIDININIFFSVCCWSISLKTVSTTYFDLRWSALPSPSAAVVQKEWMI